MGALFAWALVSGCGPKSASTTEEQRRELELIAAEELAAMESKRDLWEQTVWAEETRAFSFGKQINEFWNRLNQSADAWAVLEGLSFDGAIIVQPRERENWRPELSLIQWVPKGGAIGWAPAKWRHSVASWRDAGWRLEASEWRHVAFDFDSEQRTAVSVVEARVQIRNDDEKRRVSLWGPTRIEWRVDASSDVPAAVISIDATGWTIRERSGAPLFSQQMESMLTPPERSHFVDPLIVTDVDNDGDSDIVLASANALYRNLGGFEFQAERFLAQPPQLMSTGILEDFDGDGVVEYLGADRGGLAGYVQDENGRYSGPARRVWSAPDRIEYGMVLSAGDIDADGDLDLWFAQYKLPYLGGQMPSPVWDANDGYPCYLLENRGDGTFRDRTQAAGLADKRYRRVYAGSLVDMDDDSDLDLVVVSDFHGMDVFLNEGSGRFRDVTDRISGSRHGHGMSHIARDWNDDGALDVLMIGMGSAAARRLDHWEAHPPGTPPAAQPKRSEMTYGNRLFLGDGAGGFRLSERDLELRQTGWSWSAPALDLENDGDLDLFIANGHETHQFVDDYERQFWLYDIHFGTAEERLSFEWFAKKNMAAIRGGGRSYGGYHLNRVLLNDGDRGFADIGYLLGMGQQIDCRCAVAEDFDGDGWTDIALTTLEVWPEMRQRLLVFRHAGIESENQWTRVSAPHRLDGLPTAGATVFLELDEQIQRRDLLTGEAYRSQPSKSIHFGLGPTPTAELSLRIRFPGGEERDLKGFSRGNLGP